MINFVAAIHILGAISLIGLVLIQDSKDGAMGGLIGSGSSNSLLGATGATTFLEKLTRGMAVFFALTCIGLTVLTPNQQGSVLDSVTAPLASPQTTTPGGSQTQEAPGADSTSAPAETSASRPGAAADPAAPPKSNPGP